MYFYRSKKYDTMNQIAQNINELRSYIPSHVKIIAVSKTKTVPKIREAMDAGQFFFGESKVQELLEKHKQIPDAQWHLIGHLQTNKVKYIASFVQMIHSVDSLRLIQEVDCQANKHNRIIDCLLQIHIACEETKYGFSEQEIIGFLETDALQTLKNVRICGLMGIATYTTDTEVVRKEFRRLSNFFQLIRSEYFLNAPSFCELSMGMSDDYPVAIEEGSTMVRIGSLIFGERP